MVKKNIFSIIVGLIILYMSLANSNTFDKVPLFKIPYVDKVVHFLMYFGFMSVLIFENRKSIRGTRRLFLIAMIPFLYGILMEILQATITFSRSGSFFDAGANTIGIITSILIYILIKPLIDRKIRS